MAQSQDNQELLERLRVAEAQVRQLSTENAELKNEVGTLEADKSMNKAVQLEQERMEADYQVQLDMKPAPTNEEEVQQQQDREEQGVDLDTSANASLTQDEIREEVRAESEQSEVMSSFHEPRSTADQHVPEPEMPEEIKSEFLQQHQEIMEELDIKEVEQEIQPPEQEPEPEQEL